MQISKNREKLTLSLATEIKEYLVNESENFGMSTSAFITMVVNQYRQQVQVLNEMSKMQGIINQMKELVEKNNEGKGV